jgi:inner membrane protein
MEKTPPPLPSESSSAWFSQATIGFKLFCILALVLLLLVPLGMIGSILDERLQRKNEAIKEITSTWGQAQQIAGPILMVPYRYTYKTFKDVTISGKVEKVEVTEVAVANAYFLPSRLEVNGQIIPKKLYRGIYEAVVYTGELSIKGEFPKPDFETLKIDLKDVLWADSVVTFGITDMRGTKQALHLEVGDKRILLTPGTPVSALDMGVQARLRAEKTVDALPFKLDLTFNGSNGIRFAPLGVQNTVTLQSPWPDPGFRGSFLPVDREVSQNGFKAKWEVSYYGRAYPQQWTDRNGEAIFNSVSLRESLFGVEFVSLIDSYRTVERSMKYGILFIGLVFTAFFLFEVLAPLRIHPFQYLLVGSSLCLFYLLLLSCSEFIDFFKAYVIGAGASILLISLYSSTVLKSGTRSLVLGVGLGIIYTFLYVVLRMQDYSLLVGTVGLLITLAGVMYATRNIDWYRAGQLSSR